MMLKDAYKLTIVAVVFLISAVKVLAGGPEITIFTGYATGARLNTDMGQIHFGSGPETGGALSFDTGNGRNIIFSFYCLSSALALEEGSTVEPYGNLAIKYYSAGFLQDIKPDNKVTPFGGFSFGIVDYRTFQVRSTSENKVHFSLAAGMKVYASERFGIRMQARLLMPVFYNGTYLALGSRGSGYRMNGGIEGLHCDFTAAAFLKLVR